MRYPHSRLPLLVLGSAVVLVLGACGNGDSTASEPEPADTETTQASSTSTTSEVTPPGSELPRLADISVTAADDDSTVELTFEPGKGVPTASVDESDDPALTRPGSGKAVRLAGDQALVASVAPAIGGDTVVPEPAGPAVSEVRVLGFFKGRTTVGIGINGEGELRPQVSKPDENTIRIVVGHPPYPAEDPRTRQCGDVGFEPNTDNGAFGITATGVECDVARDVAAFVEGDVGDPYGTPSGYSCLPERDDSGPMTTFNYTCTRGDATITFAAS